MALNSAVTKAQIVFLYIQVARGSHFGASQHTVHRRTNVIMTNGWSGDLRPPQPDVSVIWAQKCYQRHKSAWNMKQHLQIAYLSLVQSRRFCVNVNKYLFKTKLSSFFGISNLCSAIFWPERKALFFLYMQHTTLPYLKSSLSLMLPHTYYVHVCSWYGFAVTDVIRIAWRAAFFLPKH